jgi:hypothetical protein
MKDWAGPSRPNQALCPSRRQRWPPPRRPSPPKEPCRPGSLWNSNWWSRHARRKSPPSLTVALRDESPSATWPLTGGILRWWWGSGGGGEEGGGGSRVPPKAPLLGATRGLFLNPWRFLINLHDGT